MYKFILFLMVPSYWYIYNMTVSLSYMLFVNNIINTGGVLDTKSKLNVKCSLYYANKRDVKNPVEAVAGGEREKVCINAPCIHTL
jgi:hypothetical protein